MFTNTVYQELAVKHRRIRELNLRINITFGVSMIPNNVLRNRADLVQIDLNAIKFYYLSLKTHFKYINKSSYRRFNFQVLQAIQKITDFVYIVIARYVIIKFFQIY